MDQNADMLDELMPDAPELHQEPGDEDPSQPANRTVNMDLDLDVTSPDSSIMGTAATMGASATKTKGLGRNVQGYRGISQRTKASTSLSGTPSRDNIYATPRTQRAQGPLDLYSPMRYGPPAGSNAGTPSRRFQGRHDVGEGMEIPHRGGQLPTITDGEPELYIWGTSVDINQCKTEFRTFLENFVKDVSLGDDHPESMADSQDPTEETTGFYYLDVFNEMAIVELPQLNLNCKFLKSFNANLYHQLIAYPQEVIPVFDMAATELFIERLPAKTLPAPIQVRPYNLTEDSLMRKMNPEDIDRLVSIQGMVIRTSNVVPELRDVMFMCNVCEHRKHEEIHRGKISEPTLCENCNSTHSYGVMHNLSRFSDVQIVKIQESQEDMPPGQTPHTILVYVHDSLVDTVQAGDRIVVTGVYRAVPIRVNPRHQVIRSVYKTNIDVVHFQRKDKRQLNEVQEELEQLNLSQTRMDEIRRLAQRPDVYEQLSRALAPSIYECDDIKKGVLLQLLGGSRKDFSKVGRGRPRCEINILLCGDPGTSKSQMLQYVHKVAPRGQYTSGKGSSAVGLTAYVTRDPDTRQFCLQSGALVLSDNGVCCIDEFDKMNESTRSVLHEVMEQQTLSVAKAGIICQLNARTSILAAANPIESQWNKDKTIIENIQLPHTLLSRFDLIFLVLDPQDEAYDKRLARHLVSIYYKTQEDVVEDGAVDMNLLKDYIAYARHHAAPKLDDEAAQELVLQYVDMRRIGKGRGQISAYPRQLESLIRLSEARAKVRLDTTVTIHDVKEAIRLYKEALKQAATDPTTGRVDLAILTTGVSTAARQRRAELAGKLREFLQTKLGPGTYAHTLIFDQFQAVSTTTFTRDHFEDALRELGEGVITFVGRNIRVS